MAHRDAGIDLEREFWEDGRVVVGIDEVGKGSWAGPLMVGAVVIPTGDRLPGVRDSKAMTERARES
ncbi:MAG: ribonuclease, partial [Actinomycetota bacterium]